MAKIHAASVRSSTIELWHKRMGHPPEQILKLIPLVNSSDKLNKACEACHRAKHSRNSFALSENVASRIFELVHCDLWGPYNTLSSCGACYFLTIVDDYSCAVWVFLLMDKTEILKTFLSFVAMIERQFSQQIKIVRSDNGTEFHGLKDYFSKTGILFQTSCVGTPQQNGRVERKHRHILNVARALRFQGNLPLFFWGECVLTVAHLINRTPSGILSNKTPYEMLFGSPPSYQELRVFGSLCYAHNQKAKGDKFASRSRKCVFVGYPYGKKGWSLFDLDTQDLFVSRDVKFFENIYPFADNAEVKMGEETLSAKNFEDVAIFEDDEFDLLDNHDSPAPPTQQTPDAILSSATNEEQTQESGAPQPSETNQEPATLGRGMRNKMPSVRLSDFVSQTVVHGSPSQSSPAPQSSSGTPFPISHYVNCEKFSVPHKSFIAAITAGVEPQSFEEAVTDKGWRVAMQSEIRALEDNGTWTMETLPPGKRALGSRWIYKISSRWIYKIKYNSDGTVERLKARLVVFGNHQVEGIDYNETFAPVAKMVYFLERLSR